MSEEESKQQIGRIVSVDADNLVGVIENSNNERVFFTVFDLQTVSKLEKGSDLLEDSDRLYKKLEELEGCYVSYEENDDTLSKSTRQAKDVRVIRGK